MQKNDEIKNENFNNLLERKLFKIIIIWAIIDLINFDTCIDAQLLLLFSLHFNITVLNSAFFEYF